MPVPLIQQMRMSRRVPPQQILPLIALHQRQQPRLQRPVLPVRLQARPRHWLLSTLITLRFLKPQVLPPVKLPLLVRLLPLLVQLTPSLSRLHQRLLRKLKLPATRHQLPDRPLSPQVVLLPLEIQPLRRVPLLQLVQLLPPQPLPVRLQAMPPRLLAKPRQLLQRPMKRQAQLLKPRQRR